ncbi:hypothetical protein DVH24_035117 [Malus domestica]|uniref:Uncharacterized protein n=1 Tax=Malus domestica TaxID=3750 RepID=A0A498IE47_MALDO|nr:hypothetical protein DVH24_035117 [Malus domestica]
MYRSLSMNEFDWSPNARCDHDGYSYGSFYGGGQQSEAVAIPLLWINDQGKWHDGYHLVPT